MIGRLIRTLSIRATAAWTRVYTFPYPPELRARYIREIGADVQEQANEGSPAKAGASILLRTARGVPFDLVSCVKAFLRPGNRRVAARSIVGESTSVMIALVYTYIVPFPWPYVVQFLIYYVGLKILVHIAAQAFMFWLDRRPNRMR